MLEYVETLLADHPPPSVLLPVDHPMREITRALASGRPWTTVMQTQVGELFAGMAAQWHSTRTPARYDDALARGLASSAGTALALELGAGTGLGTERIAARFGSVVAVDLVASMIGQISADVGLPVVADASTLPVRSSSVDAVLLVNMFLFAAEVDRVLGSEGSLIWVNTAGEHTPIHLEAEEVLDALPGDWTGTAGRLGLGTWLVARRAGDS